MKIEINFKTFTNFCIILIFTTPSGMKRALYEILEIIKKICYFYLTSHNYFTGDLRELEGKQVKIDVIQIQTNASYGNKYHFQ